MITQGRSIKLEGDFELETNLVIGGDAMVKVIEVFESEYSKARLDEEWHGAEAPPGTP